MSLTDAAVRVVTPVTWLALRALGSFVRFTPLAATLTVVANCHTR